jgi:hypothetical protein
MPANYDAGVFENCDANDEYVALLLSSSLILLFAFSQPMGVYGTSTWHQGVSPTPPPHPAASSSNCQTLPTVSVSPAMKRHENRGFEKRYVGDVAFPEATPSPRH